MVRGRRTRRRPTTTGASDMSVMVRRILDANFNRASEALRVLEDYARLGLSDGELASDLKSLRHDLAAALRQFGPLDLMLARDTVHDPGVGLTGRLEWARPDIQALLSANAQRLSQALRVLEETGKLVSPTAAATIKTMRYRAYTLEQRLLRFAAAGGSFERVRLYVLLTAARCRRSWEETLEAILAGGADAVQLREKELSDAELLSRAETLVKRCRPFGALAIINDRLDIALAAGAQGVHLGQHDLPCAAARKIAGADFIIGVSTENLPQAQAAVRDGASYVAVGAMFASFTKSKPHLAGPAYAEAVIQARWPVPAVAIGGITPENIGQLRAVGITTVAVSSAVIAADDPQAVCRRLREALGPPAASGSSPGPG